MQGETLEYVLKMRDEANRVLQKFKKEMGDTGQATGKTAKEMRAANDRFREAGKVLDDTGKKARHAGDGFSQMAKRMGEMVTGATVLYGLQRATGSALRSFMTLEDGMSEVRKTTGLTGADLQAVQGDLQAMAREIPLAGEKFTELAAVAGRAGITGRDGLEEFTRTAAQMQVALDGIDAETLLRTLGLTREALDENGGVAGNMKTFAATLNLLDDTSKTSAQRILFLATDVAAAGAQFNLSYKDVLAWSTVLAEAGVDAGIASTTINRLGASIVMTTAEGGPQLEAMAQLAGMTAEQFRKLADSDTAGAINAVLGGLNKLQETNKAGYYKALEQFGLEALQAQAAINPLAKGIGNLHERIKQVNDEPLALAKFDAENQAQVEKFSAQLILFQNSWEQLKASIGADFADAILPILQWLGQAVDGFREWYDSLDDGSQKFVAFTAVVTVAAVGLMATFGQLAFAFRGFTALAGMLGLSGIAAGSGIGAMAAAAAPALVVVGGLAAGVAVLTDAFHLNSEGVMGVAGATAEGAAKLEEYRQKAEIAAASTGIASNAAATMGDRMAYARTHVWNLDQALKNMGVTAQWAAFQMARARMVEINQELADVRRNKVIFGSMPVVGGIATEIARRKEDALLKEKGEMVTGMASAAVDATNTIFKISDKPPAAAPVSAPPTAFGGGAGAGNKPNSNGGGSSQESEAERKAKQEVEARSEALRENRLAVAEANDAFSQLMTMQGASNDEIDEAIAKSSALWELRKRSGNESAQLTADEIKQIEDRIVAEKNLADVEDDRRRAASAAIELSAEQDYAEGRRQIGFGDTKENAMALAALQETVSLKAQNKVITEEELLLARQRAGLQWEENEALRQYNEMRQQADEGFRIFENAIGGLITGASSLKDTLRSTISAVADLAAQYLILLPIKRAFDQSMNAGGGFFGSLAAGIGSLFANGGAFDSRGVQFFASGGVVGSPTAFRHAGGLGVMGEAGPEAIMPLERGANGKLGVRAVGNAPSPAHTTFAPHISVSVEAPEGTSNPAEFGRIIGQAIDSKLATFVRKETRPGGMLYGR